MLKSIPSIRKKQIVAVTGLGLVLFLLAHLSGNFLIYKGPEALNGYSEFLRHLGLILWTLRAGLIACFAIHIFFTAMVVMENRAARKQRYYRFEVHTESRSISVRTMPITGTIVLGYLFIHLLDFTFRNHTGLVNGVDMGLYGLVVNTLGNPWHAAGYIVAMGAIGLHLSHAIQSVFQTFGLSNRKWMPVLNSLSLILGWGIAIAYSTIPIYILSAFH